jgi:hypothetical protein
MCPPGASLTFDREIELIAVTRHLAGPRAGRATASELPRSDASDVRFDGQAAAARAVGRP